MGAYLGFDSVSRYKGFKVSLLDARVSCRLNTIANAVSTLWSIYDSQSFRIIEGKSARLMNEESVTGKPARSMTCSTERMPS